MQSNHTYVEHMTSLRSAVMVRQMRMATISMYL